jgi:rhamnosyltransferase
MNKVSVVIPVKNGIHTIKKCIDGILSQNISVEEIVVIDSGSTDGTIELLKKYDKVKLIEIPADEFNHGETRNIGVQHATGEYVVLTVQDAWPVDENWLDNLFKGLVNKDVVAVCGQQVVPHDPDKNPAQWFRPYSAPKIVTHSFSKDAYNAMSPSEKQTVCCWDDVTAMYKRDILLALPFRKTPFAEDAWWANDALLAGYTIAYNYNARVYHYHHEDAEFAFKRYYAEIFSTYTIFKLLPEMPKLSVQFYSRLAKSLYIAKGISFTDKFRWWKHNINLVKSYRRSCELFYQTLGKGEDELKKSYARICNRILASETN